MGGGRCVDIFVILHLQLVAIKTTATGSHTFPLVCLQ